MVFDIKINKKLTKNLYKLPENIQDRFFKLVQDLRDKGPIQDYWPNYSPIGKNKYHCHLKYSWVACWKYEKETIIIEVYYVGSRENAPY